MTVPYADLSNRTEKMILSDDTTIREVTDLEGLPATAAETDATKTTVPKMGWLKGLVKILADVWNSTAHSLKVTVTGSSLTKDTPMYVAVGNAQGTIGATGPTQAVIVGGLDSGSKVAPFYTIQAVPDGDGGYRPLAVANVAYTGAGYDKVRVAYVFKRAASAPTIAAGGGTLTLWTPATNKKQRLMGGILAVDSAANCQLKTVGGWPLFGFRTAGAETIPFLLGQGVIASSANDPINIVNWGASPIAVEIILFGTEE